MAGVCGGFGLNEIFGPINYFFEQLLLSFLPFWKEFFILIAAVAWPASVFAIARLFRQELTRLLQRLRGVSMAGAQISFTDQHVPGSVFTSSTQPLRELLGVERTPAIEAVEKDLLQLLEAIDPNDRYDSVVRALAHAKLDTAIVMTHSAIFGSQIILLRKIRESGHLSRSACEEYFKKRQEESDLHADYKFDDYAKFLFNSRLIVETDGKIRLTPFGNDFLAALHRLNLSTDRLL